MSRNRLPFVILAANCIVCIALLALGASCVYAESELILVVSEGQPMKETKADWPDGTVDMINDPLRTNGYQAIGGGIVITGKNDVRMFEFCVESNDEIQHLIDLLTRIRAKRLCLQLNPRPDSGTIIDAAGAEKGNGIAVLFEIGCQSEIDSWFSRLETDESGARRFLGYRLTKPPIAMPPTLTLFTGSHAVDLPKLRIPAEVEVTKNYGSLARTPATEQIEKFVDEHNRRRREMGLPEPPEPSNWITSAQPSTDQQP